MPLARTAQRLPMVFETEFDLTSPIADLSVLLRSMEPVHNPGEYVFTTLDEVSASALSLGEVVACVREPEGLSVVVPAAAAASGSPAQPDRFAWITLSVHSDLQAVGLTAAFATALGQAGISCNVVAGHRHDHIFVPLARVEAAMAALRALQRGDPPQTAAG